MTTVTPNMIKELRERTGIGMGKCKEALEEAGGDMDKAISNLRKAGLASAVKKEGRETKEGIIASCETDQAIGIVEVAAETDFVIQNDRFREFVNNVVKDIAKSGATDLEQFIKQKTTFDPAHTIDEVRALLVQAIGENIQIKRILSIPKEANKSYGIYSHLGGRIVTIVIIEGSANEAELARNIGMHIAAASPEYLSPETIPAEIIEHEKEIARAQMKGKPADIIEKILTGKIKSFCDETCLVNQKYIRDDSKTIGQVVEEKAKTTGKPLKITSFIRWNR